MSTDSTTTTTDVRSQRIREFMQFLPLTLELAGLPKCDMNRLLTQDQMDLRCTTIRNAYKLARQLVRDIGEGT